MRQLVILLVLSISLFAQSAGELSFFLLKDGKPLANQNIVVFQTKENKQERYAEFTTDSDGYIASVLPVGVYQLQVLVKDKNFPQAFIRKNFLIASDQESQLIVSLKSDNTLLFEDSEAPELSNTKTHKIQDKELVNGFCQINISSSEDKNPIKNARLFVKGFSIDLKSDDKGNVLVEIPEGNQTISIIHSDFSAQTLRVTVMANETIMKFVELTPAAMELEEFVVLAPQVEGSVAAMMAEEKNSESIANVIGSEQMSKQGDSNAASALKRVAGITLMGGKYIYVRGLGDRYSSTELNGMPLPSPNPIKRTVPLDMFPSGVIGSLQVQKTFSPDVTGAFGGGYVNIRTKKTSDEEYAKIKLGLSMHSTTGSSATTYQGSSSDWTGSDDGYRAFNDSFIDAMTPVIGERQSTLDYTSQEMKDMIAQRDLNAKTTSIPMGTNIEIEAARNFVIANEHELSFLASYGYKSEASSKTYVSYDYILSRFGVQSDAPDNTSTNDVYKEAIQHGGIFNAAYKYKNFDFRYTKLYVLNTLNQTRDIRGTFGENNSDEQQYYFEWQERELNIDQFSGSLDYNLLVDNKFNFGLEFAKAKEYVPNDVFYSYQRNSTDDPYEFKYRQNELSYSYRTTNDDLVNFYLNNRSRLELLSDQDYIEIGVMKEQKTREGKIQRLRVQSLIRDTDVSKSSINDIIDYGDGGDLTYALTSRPKDQYDASLDRDALYFKSMLKPSSKLDINFGARYIDLTQTVDQYALVDNLVTTEKNTLAFDKLLPSLSMKYVLDDNNQFRFAYTETFVYPDFREFINSEFIHPVFVAKISGNPDLVETDIQSLDFQYAYYMDSMDNITTSVFYKHMNNPIEDTTEFTTSTLDRYSFDNSKAADLAGIELSWYKNLEFLHPVLDVLTFSGNYTYIYSKVTLTEEQKSKFVTTDRGLQGLSPQVLNLSFTYQKDERSLNLSYNKMSERLMRVALKNGDVILGLDDYEIPPHLLDFTWIERFYSEGMDTNFSLSFKIKNILDSKTVWKQGDKTTLEYKTGTSYSLSISAKI